MIASLTDAGQTTIGEAILFWVLAIVMVLAAGGLLFVRKAVHAALSMVVVMIGLAFLYVAQDAPFLGVVQVVVYTGAIMMLFLFVLMLVDAVFPAASEVVMVYAGAVASGAFADQDVVLFGATIDEGMPAYVAIALAGTIGYTVGSVIGWDKPVLSLGLYPFVLGDLVKLALAACLVTAGARLVRR